MTLGWTLLLLIFIMVVLRLLPGFIYNLGNAFGKGFMDGLSNELDSHTFRMQEMVEKNEQKENGL